MKRSCPPSCDVRRDDRCRPLAEPKPQPPTPAAEGRSPVAGRESRNRARCESRSGPSPEKPSRPRRAGRGEEAGEDPPTPSPTRTSKTPTRKTRTSPSSPGPPTPGRASSSAASGPAVTSGRVVDLAVDPTDQKHWLRRGRLGRRLEDRPTPARRWTPVFDDEGSYSIGCVTLDPKNPIVVWVGTGENNSQRSVGYGDGVYKSRRRRQELEERRPRRAPSTSARSSSTRATPTSSTSRRRGRCGRRAATAGSTRRPTAARPGTQVLDDQREHRRHRRRARPAQPRRAASPPPTSAAATSGRSSTAARSRRIYKIDRRRQDLDEAHERPAEGRAGPHRPGDRARPSPTWSTPSSRRADKKGGIFRSTRPRRDLGEAQRLRPAGRSTTHELVRRPEERRPRLRRWTCSCRSPTTAARRCATLGEQCKHVDNHVHLDRPGRHRPLPRRLRRRPLRELRPRRDLAVHRNLPVTQFYDVAVRRRRARSTTSTAARRTTTRSAARRARDSVHGITQHRLVRHQGGDGFQREVDPRTRTSSTAEPQYGVLVALRPADRRDASDPAAAGQGRAAAALELGLAAHHQPALATRGSTSRRSGSSAATTAATRWKPISGDLTRQLDRNKLHGDGQGLGRRRRRQERLDLASTATSSRSPSRRRRRGCSTSAPTTA